MTTPRGHSKPELDQQANDVLGYMVLLLAEGGLVEGMLEGFETAAAQISWAAQPLHKDLARQLIFEFLCFTSFNTFVVAPGFIGYEQGAAFEPDVPSCHAFYQCLKGHLSRFCVKHGLCDVADPVQGGKAVDPNRRLADYAFDESKQPGSAMEHFTRIIGFSFGPANHFIGTTLAMHYARPLLEVAIAAMRMVFGPPAAERAGQPGG